MGAWVLHRSKFACRPLGTWAQRRLLSRSWYSRNHTLFLQNSGALPANPGVNLSPVADGDLPLAEGDGRGGRASVPVKKSASSDCQEELGQLCDINRTHLWDIDFVGAVQRTWRGAICFIFGSSSVSSFINGFRPTLFALSTLIV